jgi:membrane-bound ClpP family serine protease
MDLSFLKQLAPTVASALGGPLAGMAVEALANKMGVSPDDAQKVLDSGKMSGDQVAALQQAELALKAKAQEMNLDFAQLENQDRDSARKMQMANQSWIPPVMAIIVTIGFFGILFALMSGRVAKGDEVMIMLGSLGTAWTGIISFYFGSSASSQKKDELLHKSQPVE